ncbi:MAG TPA: glutamyl-tRNA reductase [Pirellulaceae bacterium]|nr:glutamyl-tRNA reductase [Pirellulaceae bacterium]
MKLQMVGCSHHNSKIELREKLAFSPEQARQALADLRTRFPESEAVLISTCNRVELYVASEDANCCPSHHEVVNFLAQFHGVESADVFDSLFEHTGEDAIRHLFTVASSLDSMVIGEAQILSQVKQAYDLATASNNVGPLTHAAFQAAIHVAKRVTTETSIQQKRVSIPSVAVVFAREIFETFHDKQILVIGAGEMGADTLRYLKDEGAQHIRIVNRSGQRAEELAQRMGGEAHAWGELHQLLVEADLVVSTTGATEPIVGATEFKLIERERYQRPLVILDLAVPRDFAPAVANFSGVYLYSIDDLSAACDANRREREREWPAAERIIEEETARFMGDWHHRATGPTIKRLKQRADELKIDELARLMNKLTHVDERAREEIRRSFDRLVNKLLHPPLESLRDEAAQGAPHGLLEALKRLFRLQD